MRNFALVSGVGTHDEPLRTSAWETSHRADREESKGQVNTVLKKNPGGDSGFQVTGMIEGFFGFEIFDFGISLGTKFWQVFFGWLDLSRDSFGYSKQYEDSVIVPRYPGCVVPLEFFKPRKFGMGFFGVKFWSKGFFGF